MSVLITAHSGFDAYEDNRLKSIIKIKEIPVDYFEIDVRMTKDGIPVCEHEPSIEGYWISKEPYALLPDYLITVERVLELLKDGQVSINFDIKDIHGIPYVEKLIRKHGYQQRHVLTGLNGSQVKEVKSTYPWLCTFMNDHGVWNDSKTFCRNLEEGIRLSGCDGLNIDHRFLTPEIIRLKKVYKIPLAVWTVNDYQRLKTCISMGVDMITTRKVEDFIHEFKTDRII